MHANSWCCEPTSSGTCKLKLSVMILLMCGLLGCGQESAGVVSGKVTHKGKPVVHGNVTFFRPGTSEVAIGALGDGGVYQIQQADKGLAAGEYKVTVTPFRVYQDVEGPEGKDVKIVLQGAENIPVKYRRRDSTPLMATVSGGDDKLDFELMP